MHRGQLPRGVHGLLQRHLSSSLAPRRPGLAALLSLVCPGLGHLYAGRPGAAALFAAAGWAAALSLPLEVAFFPGGARLALACGGVVCGSYWLLQVVLAARAAGSSGLASYRLRPFNRFITYFLFAAVFLAGLLGEALLVRAHVVELFRVSSSSMLPTLHRGDLVIVPKLGPEARAPRPGDLVVFEVPYRTLPDPWVKRVVALAGQQVEVRDGRLSIRGLEVRHRPVAPAALLRPLPAGLKQRGAPPEMVAEDLPGSSYAILVSPHGEEPELLEDRFEQEPLVVPPGHVYLLGDARYNSRDSRNFGPVPLGRVIGRVACIF